MSSDDTDASVADDTGAVDDAPTPEDAAAVIDEPLGGGDAADGTPEVDSGAGVGGGGSVEVEACPPPPIGPIPDPSSADDTVAGTGTA